MFFPALCALLPLLASALYTPRSPALRARHAAILNARAPAPLPAPLPAPAPLVKIGKRSSKKCRPRPTSSSLPAPSHAPQNPGQDPAQSSSQQPQPTQQPPPTHTTHKPSPTHSSHTPAPTQPSGGNDPFGHDFYTGTQTGQLTFYELGLTACGQTYSDSDYVAAVSHSLFDNVPGANANPNDNPICGHKVHVTYQGNSIDVRIVDRCTGCAPTDLDLSPSAFVALAPQSLGRLSGAKWEWA